MLSHIHHGSRLLRSHKLVDPSRILLQATFYDKMGLSNTTINATPSFPQEATRNYSRMAPKTMTFATNDIKNKLIVSFPSIINSRPNSSNAASKISPMEENPQDFHNTPMKEMPHLDNAIVHRIKQELADADVNSDGRIDSEELKQILRKHGSAFTDAEIVEIGELFYTSKAGSSVSHERFLQAIEHAAATNNTEDNEVDLTKPHFRTSVQPHPLGIGKCPSEFLYGKSHGLYTPEELNIKLTHLEPTTTLDKAAFQAVKAVRLVFDTATGWNRGKVTTEKILIRTIYLETIAAVPGMVAAIIRHFKSLRTMQRDGGMLNMFLEEANNERMHLLTFVGMKNPGKLFRAAVIAGQFGFGTFFLAAYLIHPKFCHRFVGYIEEEACTTYTKIIKEIEDAPEDSDLAQWRTELAPKIARAYWHLGESGTVLDMFYAVRADEAEHRDVNHVVSGVPDGVANPLCDPEVKFDKVFSKYLKELMKTSS